MAVAKKAEVAKKETGNAIVMKDLLKKTGPSLSERTTEDFAIP